MVAIVATGCRCASREVKTQAGGMKDINLTWNQIRLRMRALVGPLCGEIEQAADRIAAGTTNRTVQRAALEWKIEAVPAMRGALFQPDPLTALVDVWAVWAGATQVNTIVLEAVVFGMALALLAVAFRIRPRLEMSGKEEADDSHAELVEVLS